jgi:hypothetical protein
MLKTISAALLAVSVLAAPALAADTGKAAQAPVTKSTQAPATTAKTVQKSDVKGGTKGGAMNANAKMGRHHQKHARHYRHHTRMSNAGHAKAGAKVSFKRAPSSTTKRG